MPYEYATEDQDYSDYSGGRVIYSQPGAPAFPVRLASEIFQRAQAHLGTDRRLRLYDPCCGGAYHLCAVGFLHGASIASILASDIDENVLALARRNLGLLTQGGLLKRQQELNDLYRQYSKESHALALGSASRLLESLHRLPGQEIPSRIFQANALDGAALRNELSGEAIDLVISDIPYGWMTGWQGTGANVLTPAVRTPGAQTPAAQLLAALHPLLPEGALAAIAADKSQKVAHEGFRRVERFQVGRRQIIFLQPVH